MHLTPGGGEVQSDSRPKTHFALHLDFPTVLFYDSLSDRQSQTCSLWHCGEKRLKDPLQVFLGDTHPGILYDDSKVVLVTAG